MLLWATACLIVTTDEGYEWWRIYPIKGALALAAIWHAALILFEKHRLAYAVYALFDVPAFYAVYWFAMILAIRFPL